MNVRSRTLAAALLALSTGSSAAAQTGPTTTPPREQPAATRQVHGFNIVLVLGETQLGSGVEGTEDIPLGARKALADMREFLPYKHYRVLDTQWTSCCAGLNSVLSGQLRGMAAARGGTSFVDRAHVFQLTVSESSQGLSVRFALADKVDSSPRETTDIDRQRDASLQRERADLRDQLLTMEVQLAEAKKKFDVGVMTQVDLRQMQDKYESMKRQFSALMRASDGQHEGQRGSIIDSSFIMQPGETVVVGTSRLGGDKAIIALVTAAKKPGTGK